MKLKRIQNTRNTNNPHDDHFDGGKSDKRQNNWTEYIFGISVCWLIERGPSFFARLITVSVAGGTTEFNQRAFFGGIFSKIPYERPYYLNFHLDK